MGEQNVHQHTDRAALRGFLRALLRDVRALEWMLQRGWIESGIRRLGAEQELFLVDRTWRPAPRALAVLEHQHNPRWTTELARFNLEINLDPHTATGDCLSRMEGQLREELTAIRAAAHTCDAEIALMGILATLRTSDLTLDNMTPRPRYRALNDTLNQMRGGHFEFRLKGIDEIALAHGSVMLEACCTSFQVHVQVDPDQFANRYNLAQVVTAPLLAAATNSPFLFGRRLWRETRIPLFQQSLDTRTSTSHLRERRPRVSFGSRWIRESVVELFAEDIAWFPVLLAAPVEEDPFEALAAGRAPELQALRTFNGTVYRWNRACYGIGDGKPHLRIENRALPAGPTVVDEIANAAFFLGLMTQLPAYCPDVTRVLDFSHAETNFLAAAQHGLAANLIWLDGRLRPARDLILQELLPIAREGLHAAGIVAGDIDHYLGVLEERVRSGQTGSQWLLDSFEHLRGQDRPDFLLRCLIASTVRQQWSEQPVHRWSLPELTELDRGDANMRIEECMTTDLLTVHPDEPVDLVLHLMDWKRIRHVPVEDEQGQLVGLVSWYDVIRYLRSTDPTGELRSVREIMQTNLPTVAPESSLHDAVQLLKQTRSDSLAVVKEGRLVGIVTEHDFFQIALRLLDSPGTEG